MSAMFGAFGKIPALGDFLRLQVAAGFVQPWDDWLQASMIAAREALQDSWTESYLSAPIWRFTLPAGACGPKGMTGILMASIDRVGRQYPLTLVAPQDTADTAISHFANTGLFERLEQIALAMLDDGNTRETLIDALEPLMLTKSQMHGDVVLPYAGELPPEHVMAGHALSQRAGAHRAIWSTAMQGDHRLMLTRALPEGRDMLALFDLSLNAQGTPDMATLT